MRLAATPGPQTLPISAASGTLVIAVSIQPSARPGTRVARLGACLGVPTKRALIILKAKPARSVLTSVPSHEWLYKVAPPSRRHLPARCSRYQRRRFQTLSNHLWDGTLAWPRPLDQRTRPLSSRLMPERSLLLPLISTPASWQFPAIMASLEGDIQQHSAENLDGRQSPGDD